MRGRCTITSRKRCHAVKREEIHVDNMKMGVVRDFEGGCGIGEKVRKIPQ